MPGHPFRVFISSPSDVFAERERVERVIARLNGEFAGRSPTGSDSNSGAAPGAPATTTTTTSGMLQAIRWERAYYTAAKTFQDQIPLPSETDLVLCILWKRLGFELPPDYRRPDGTTPTGTEYEFEDAMAAARSRGTPDVLVYRKSAPVLLDAEQVEIERAQFEALKTFWSRWFRNETGHFTAAYQSFQTTDEFEHQVEEHLRQWLARHDVGAAGITWPIELRGSPFRGLEPFDAGHAAVFFGRARAVERARERLADAAARGTAFLLVLGTSGSGKSSLARAGLLPRLSQPGAVPGIDTWRTAILRPSEGDTPLHALARALFRADALPELAEGDSPTPPDLAGLLTTAPDAAARAIRRALDRASAALAKREGFDRPVEARLLLLVDQFEEALAPAAREPFAAALTALASSGATWIVATLRSDLYAPFQASPGLTALRDGGAQLDLLPPNPAELAAIVTAPALAAGLQFDSRPDGATLDETLIAAAQQPGALPLLQLTLDALFEARDVARNLLTFAAYDALGGLEGVIQRRAEATLAALDAEAAGTLAAVLRTLVAVSDDGLITSRAAPRDLAGPTPAAQRLVDAFVAARLLVADTQAGVTRIRVAHDALLSAWTRAAETIAADRERLRTRTRLETASRRWQAEGQDPDLLLPPGRPLAEAVELPPETLDAATLGFVAASAAADQARRAAAEALAQRELRLEAEAQAARADAATRIVRRTRAAAAAVLALLLLATGAAVYANGQRREAERQKGEAERQTAKAEQNFQAALDGGASLIAAVDAHLGDGGMTRRVARELLTTADHGIGSLLPNARAGSQAPNPTLPLPLLDTASRLQASFSSVLAAVCDSGEARTRAERALAVATQAEAAGPSDDRVRAIMQAEEALAFAFEAEGDWPAARAAFERADARAVGHPDDAAWAPLRQKVRRDLAYTMIDTPDQARAIALFQDDLRWQQPRAAQHPDDPETLAQQASDHRQLAYAARVDGRLDDWAAELDAEAGLLHRLTTLDPANVAWTRYLGLNAQSRSSLQVRRNDIPAALGQTRDSARYAATVLAHDPGNALWLINSLSADIRYAIMMVRTGDRPGALATLRPDIEALKVLTAPDTRSPLCLTEARQIQSLIGNAMVVMGNGEEGIAALQANVALASSLAAAHPDPARQRAVVDAHLELARAYVIAGQNEGVVTEARAAIAALEPLAGPDPDLQTERARLRLMEGDALAAMGQIDPALAAYADGRAIDQALLAAHPDDPAWRLALIGNLLRVNMAQLRGGRPDDQWTTLQQASAAIAPVLAQPNIPADQLRTVIEYHQAFGSILMLRHDPTAGLEHYHQALAAAEALLAHTPDDPMSRILHGQALGFIAMGHRMLGETAAAADYAAQSKAALDQAPGH